MLLSTYMVIKNSVKTSQPNLLPCDGELYFHSSFLSLKKSSLLLEYLLNIVPWQSRTIKIFGKEVLQPRLIAWFGDPGCNYRYSRSLFEPLPWDPELLKLKQRVSNFTQHQYNSVLANLYRNEKDSMGYHSDNEKELGPSPQIASISLGAEREIIFIHRNEKNRRVQVSLTNGSLLVTKGCTQKYWKHGILKKRRPIGKRINLTFRNILKPNI